MKLYEFFEGNPAGLLLIPATSHKEQILFDDLYDQVSDDAVGIPRVLERAFKLNSVQAYTRLKSDPKCLYQSLGICNDCHASVKKMIVYQSEEMIRERKLCD